MRAVRQCVNLKASTRTLPRVSLQKFHYSGAGRHWDQISSPHISSFSTVSPSFEYEWIDGADKLSGYIRGGYHPMQIADVLHNRYEVVDQLGYGGWSTVWLALDRWGKEYVAVKVGVADSLLQEPTVLRALTTSTSVPGSAAIPCILDEFRIEGPNGSHPCYTTEPALCNLGERPFNPLIPIDVARAMAYELTLAVAYVHSRGYVHGDIHLRNVLVKSRSNFNRLSIAQFREKYGEPESYSVKRIDGHSLPPGVPLNVTVPLSNMGKKANKYTIVDAHILLSDFGESYAPGRARRLGQDCNTPVGFRPPEAYFETHSPLTFSADIWSLATAIWDILGMQPLFSSAFYTDEEVLCEVVDTLGPLPIEWLKGWEDRIIFFDEKGEPKAGRCVWPKIEEAFEERVQRWRRDRGVDVFCRDESAAILNMICQMLRYRPDERPTADQVLKSEWMEKWAYPDFKRAQNME